MGLWGADPQEVLTRLKKWEHDTESVGFEMIVQDRQLYENVKRIWNTIKDTTELIEEDTEEETHEVVENKDVTQVNTDGYDSAEERPTTGKRTDEEVHKKRKGWKSWIPRLYKKDITGIGTLRKLMLKRRIQKY